MAISRCLRVVALLFVAVSLSAAAPAEKSALNIDETQIKFRLDSHPVLEIPVVNTSDQTVPGEYKLELLGTDDKVESHVSGTFRGKPGATVEKIAWPLDYLTSVSPSRLGWRRLHYSFVPRPESGIPRAEGIVQLSRVLVGLFEVRITAASKAKPGTRYPVRVRVDNPGTGKPLHGISVELALVLGDDDETAYKRTVITDRAGYASYSFDLPKRIQVHDGTITATAKRAVFTEEVTVPFKLPSKKQVTLTTDKPLYQPGQVAHFRVLALGADKRALANKDLVIAVEDEEGNEQFHETIKTSRFGVASADWSIPQKLRLGDYEASVKATKSEDEDEDYSPRVHATLRVSRYELPTFTVKAEPDRKYYLPGQKAKIQISADYLFGKPVQNAKVRLVKQQQREWNFKEQKWETEESDPVEGTLDRQGKFTADVDLESELSRFNPEDYSHYEDLTFSAYVTDVSTSRTEQRRFRVRLSEQPVQLYLVSDESSSAAGEATTVYVTSSYADGTPASVNGAVYFAEPNNQGDFEKDPWPAGRSKALTFHTNQYGVGTIALPRIPERFLVKPDYYRYYRYSQNDDGVRHALLLIEAKDKQGLQGRGSDRWVVDPKGLYLRVNTPQVLYHPGNAIPVSIQSNSSVREIIVDVSTSAGLVASRVVQLVGRHADLTFDYDPRFQGEVEITAFALTSAGDGDRALSGTTHVIYPARHDLTLGLRMARTTYRPGETASADFKIRTSEGASVESALGVLVFDRAVAERVRTDEEAGRYGFSLEDYMGEDYAWGQIAGIGVRDLLSLDANRPFSANLQLLAEVLMCSERHAWWSGNVQLEGGEEYAREAQAVFSESIGKSLLPVQNVLNAAFAKDGQYPRNAEQLRKILATKSLDLTRILDPWGVPYRPRFSVSGVNDVLTFESNGPDKVAGTVDDVTSSAMEWPYFRRIGQIIDQVAQEYQQRTGNYIRDYATLRRELKPKGIDPDTLLDPWGRRYSITFWTDGPFYRIWISSAGPDGRLGSSDAPSWDDVHEWTSSIHYFIAETADLERALAEHFQRTRQFPNNENELKPILEAASLTGGRLLDPWGNPYHFTFSERSRYSDRLNVSTYYDYISRQEKRVTQVTPVTQQVRYIAVVSYGEKNVPEQAFAVAEFSRVMAEQSSKDLEKKATSNQGPLPSGSGAISGVVTDVSGAAVPNASVTAVSQGGLTQTVRTDNTGAYLLSGIPLGVYEVRIAADGFRTWTVTRVPVQMGSSTKLDATMQVGSVVNSVVVEASPIAVQSDSSDISSLATAAGISSLVAGKVRDTSAQKPLFTPQLRKYFPETLLWKPEVITDKRGQAHIEFPMADNITAWSMSVVASTESGQVGVARKELRTFQPFFVEHNPPKVLTQGDQISLPVVLRNYSDKPQILLTDLKPESWFSMLSPAQQRVTVDAGADARAIFTFKADARVNAGKQRVSARNTETGDSVEREVQVHPDGQEVSFASGRILAGESRVLEVQIPHTAIPDSIDAELRIYPNLLAHVLDAMEGIGKKPAGCAEQVASVGYVSLQALKLLKNAGIENASPEDPRSLVQGKARKSVQDAYGLLPSLQQPNGGFSYWSNSSADAALTAYILRFLSAAGEFIEVDPGVAAKAREYLVSQQTQAGAWTRYDWSIKEQKDDPIKTAYIARALAASSEVLTGKERTVVDASVTRALSYLDERIREWNDPYLVGNYAIAAVALKHEAQIANARELLSRLAHDEGTATYWNLEANTTPFYGWGRAGRMETTALAVEALARLQTQHQSAVEGEQINRGLQYLLTHKDRYCTWFSTQATQNVLEAMIMAMPPAKSGPGESSATVLVNGAKVASIGLPKATEIVGPKVIEFGKELSRGSNNIEVQRVGDTGAMQTSVITSYYVPWTQSQAKQDENFKAGDTRALSLKVNFDRHEAKVGEALTCRVEAERIGFAGYGMMVAEIGLPPGAEVDHESLEKARKSGVDGYEVQPDRIVFYLWPTAGGSKFEFTFRPRFAINASSAPSSLYDYYNPDANAVVLPARFTVR